MTLLSRLLAAARRSPGPTHHAEPRGGPGPLVVSITVAKDEQDVVEPFVLHNLRYVDLMVVADNDSTDDTPTILRSLAAGDPRLIVCRAPGFRNAQAERMTKLFRWVTASLPARFVLPLDADEFIRSDTRATFARALDAIPAGQVGLIPWQTYVVGDRLADEARDPPRTLRFRRVTEQPGFRKVAIRIDADTPDDLLIEAGSHSVRRASGAPVSMPDLMGVHLVHVPVRSREQVVGKAVASWLARLARDPAAETGPNHTHLRSLFNRITSGVPLTDADIRRLSVTYAQAESISEAETRLVRDSVAWSYRRRFSNGEPAPAIVRLARAWRLSITASPELKEAGQTVLDRPGFEASVRRFMQTRPAAVPPAGGAP